MKLRELFPKLFDALVLFLRGQATRGLLATGVALAALGAVGGRVLTVQTPYLGVLLQLMEPAGGWGTVVNGASIFFLLLGATLGSLDWWQAHRAQQRHRVIAIEVRGLRDTADTPLERARFLTLRGRIESILLDVRAGASDSRIQQPEDAVEALVPVTQLLRAHKGGRDRQDVEVVVGGLAPVPLLMLVGALLDDESAIEVVDWDRSKEAWRQLERSGVDSAEMEWERPLEEELGQDVVLVISASYMADLDGIRDTFPGLACLHLVVNRPQIDSTWSEDRQQRVAAQFAQEISRLVAYNVRRIHIVAAVPASLAIRLGRSYDRRNMPEIRVYQYERDANPRYPWAVRLPTADRPASVVRITDIAQATS